MSVGRVEPFQLALAQLRERLRAGELAPGARVTAKEVADELRLSATPVREALSRLAGEGLLEERRGDGFFVRHLSASDIAFLYRGSQAILSLALDRDSRPRTDLSKAVAAAAAADPVRAVERLFTAWVADADSPVMAENYRRLTYQLGPARRQEGRFLADLEAEVLNLADLAGRRARRERRLAIAAFHERRLPLVEQLAEVLGPVS
jgi:DNA-binding GntR family transcriptional regulator